MKRNILFGIISVAFLALFSASYARDIRKSLSQSRQYKIQIDSLTPDRYDPSLMPSSQEAARLYREPIAIFPLAAEASAADLPEMIGLMDYSETFTGEAYRGFYSIPLDGETLPTPLLTNNFDRVYNCVIKDGIYYVHWGLDFGNSLSVYVCGYDMETKQRIYSTLLGGSLALTGADLTLDPVTNNVYGILNTVNMTGYRLATVEYSGEGAYGELIVNTISTLPDDIEWDALACSRDGKLYAISAGDNAVLYSVDKTSGALTLIGETGVATNVGGSAEIDEKTGRCFWTVNSPDHKSSVYEVNLNNGEASLVSEIAGNSDFVGLVIPPAVADEAAPDAPLDLTVDFPGGGLSGTISFTSPKTTFGGKLLDGELKYTLEVDNVALKSGKTAAGKPESINFTMASTGSYVFSVYLTNKAGNGPKAVCRKYIGLGTPKTPENITASYADGKLRVEWEPVVESSDGGYINPEEVTYTIYKGNMPVSENQKTTFYEEEIEIEGHAMIKLAVNASYQGKTSALGQCEDLIFGHLDVPYSQTFDDENSMLEFTNFTAASGSNPRKWEYKYDMIADDYKPQVRYNMTASMDAWLITSPIMLEGGKAYRITLDAFGSGGSVEIIEITAGKGNKKPDQTVTVVAPTEVHMPDGNVRNAVPLEGYFTPEEDGLYYIGIHGLSEPNQGYLWIDNLEIETGISAAAPAAVTDLSVIPGSNGKKEVTISFKAPETDLSGKPLENLTSISILSGVKEIKTIDNPMPGEIITFIDQPAAAGDYTYTIVPYTSAGAGRKASASVYVGLPFPAAVEEAQFVELSESGDVLISWSPVNTDEHGQPLDVANVTYLIRQVTPEGLSEPIVEGLTATEYKYKAVEDGEEQKFVQFVVYAATERGTGEPAYTNFMPIGPGFTSFSESFSNGQISTILGTGYDTNGGSWVILKDASDVPSSDNDNGFAAMYAPSGGSCGIFTGKINLSAFQHPSFKMNIYNWSDQSIADKNEISVDVRVVGEENWKTLETFCPGEVGGTKEGWYPVSVSLSAYKDKNVQIKVQATALNYVYVPVDAFKVVSLVDQDMAIHAIDAPSRVTAGANFNIMVTASNEGGLKSKDYEVVLYKGSEEIARKECQPLEPGAKESISFPISMHPLAAKRVWYHAKMVYDGDENDKNNSSEIIFITPTSNTLPAVNDLTGSIENNGPCLRWSEPEISGANKIVENFDSYENGSDNIAEWTLIDRDKGVVAGIQTATGVIDIPGVVPGESTHSFFVLDTRSLVSIDDALLAPSGNMALASIGLKSGANDDWAISPELSGKTQTVSFKALSLTDENPEKIRLLYSTGSLDPEDFKEVAVFSNIPEDWTSFQAVLPEGAKRFAINSCAPDGAMLLIDDVTYSNGTQAIQLTLAGFNIYRDGEKINTEPVEECSYIDKTPVSSPQAVYQVTVIYEGEGESGGSNSVSLDLSSIESHSLEIASVTTSKGHIRIITGNEEINALITSTDGKMIYNGIIKSGIDLSVEPGIYIIAIGKTTHKIMVE